MSHVHNLFHKTQAHGSASSSAPISVGTIADFDGNASVRNEGVARIPQVPEFLPTAPEVTEFQVEQARIRPEHRLVSYTDPHSHAADRFRYLRMRLREPWSAGRVKKLLITSPLPGDGKSTVALNLATMLSERGRRKVLLLEADLHRSCFVEKLGLKAWAGLAECLHDGLNPLSAIRRVDPFGWYLLPAGEPTGNPTELLQTPALPGILQQVASHFDWVLIDSPPTVPLTDAISLRQHTDATLVVVRADSTPREVVEQTTTLLGSKNIIAIILNGVTVRNHPYSKYRSYDPGLS